MNHDDLLHADQPITVQSHFYSELAARKRKERGAAQRKLTYATYLSLSYGAIWLAYLSFQANVASYVYPFQEAIAAILGILVLFVCARVINLHERIENLGPTIYLYDTIQIHNDALQALQNQQYSIESPGKVETSAPSLAPPIPSRQEHGAEVCIEWYVCYGEPQGMSQQEFADKVGYSLRHIQRELQKYRKSH